MDRPDDTAEINKEHLVDGIYSVTDLIDMDELRALCQDFTNATGFTIGFLDHPNLNILIATGWRDICTKWHRENSVANENCEVSNRHLLNSLDQPGKLVIEKCKNGLVDCAFPIIVKGKHIASLATGQLLLEKPDIEQFKRQAKSFGFNEKDYLESLREVPVVTEEELLGITGFLGKMALLLSELGYARITIKEEAEILKQEISTRKKIEREQQKLQEQCKQAQKMESIGRLAGGVAHDFNNMLTVILGYINLAIEKADATHPIYNDLKEVKKAAEHSSTLTQQLLAFARKQPIEPRILNLNAAISNLLKMLSHLMGEDIDLGWIPGDNLSLVLMDPSQLDQILVNLCVNARDAISGVGKVTVETSGVTLDEVYCAEHPGFIPGSFIMITVSDDGCGMDRKTVSNIFEPFFSTKLSEKGTGLGLSTVYGIVKQNNGFINVYSESGQGTAFNIYLPIHAEKSNTKQAESGIHLPVGGSETIMFVEDEEMMLEFGKRVLENLGYKVIAANSPKKALLLSRDYIGVIDLLITDIVMPEMNGKELADQIKYNRSEIKVLFVSGYTSNVLARHGIIEKEFSFLPKPFSSKELAYKIRRVLEKNDIG